MQPARSNTGSSLYAEVMKMVQDHARKSLTAIREKDSQSAWSIRTTYMHNWMEQQLDKLADEPKTDATEFAKVKEELEAQKQLKTDMQCRNCYLEEMLKTPIFDL